MVDCRYTSAWICTLYRKEGNKNVVDKETCQLCMTAKEITQAALLVERSIYMCAQMNKAIRTMNVYIGRLQRALEKLEAEN